MKKAKRKVFADTKAKRILALAPQAVGQDYAAVAREDEPVGVIACLCIEGPLAQSANDWFESYDMIVDRFTAVMAEPSVQAVVLKFNSPGGDVAGLFEAAKTMNAVKATMGKPVYAYVDEACYSAAYALAMVSDEIYMPASAGCGSVGVITCMVDVSENNAENGIRVEVITSGDQKADGHPDVPLTDDAIERTQERVDALAAMFFDLVATSRGLSSETVKGFQAGIFQGQEAVDAGLADGIMSWADLVSAISSLATPTMKEARMAGKLQAIREENERAAALAASTPAAEVKFKHTKKMIEVIESEDDPSAESDDDDDSDEDEDPKKKKDDAKAMAALVAELTGGKKGKAAIGALLAVKESTRREATLARRLEVLEAERAQEKVAALVNAGMKAGKLTPAHKSWAMALDAETLKGFLAATSAIVNTVEEAEVPVVNKAAFAPSADQIAIWKKMGMKTDAEIAACSANHASLAERKALTMTRNK